ncbi:MAG: serine hydrolase [Candidatus Azobacteroides sp.]|nr:serine hydrolase [Candidatus Azobacteroides sp.]
MKKLFVLSFLQLLFLSVCFGQITPDMISSVSNKNRMNQWVDSIFNKMTLDEKIGQCFVITFEPQNTTANTNKVKRLINNVKIGGLLFSKGDFTEQAIFTNMAQNLSSVPLFITLDGEWGLSMRLEGTTRFPKNVMLGAIQDLDLLYEYGREVGRQCREMGIQMNFAPDIDVNSNPNNPVIGTRAFGDNPERVAQLGIAYSRGLESMGVISVAKHFPGHGDTKEDSHNTLANVTRSRSELENIELYPFRKYVEAKLSGVMVSHLYVPALDNTPNQPATFSKKIITDLLKDEMGFEGLIVTDALVMKGAGSGDMCVKALLAGNDILLNPANPESEFEAVKKAVEKGEIPQELIDEKCRKILTYKFISGLAERKDIRTSGLKDRLNTPEAELVNRKLNENAITLGKNENNLLPLKELDKKEMAFVSIGEGSRTSFQRSLLDYNRSAVYNITSGTTAARINTVLAELKKCDVIIVGIHSTKNQQIDFIQRLIKQNNNVVLTFFISPYQLSRYEQVIKQAPAVVMAYENTPLAMEYAGQAIFGGTAFKGIFPASIKGVMNEGEGIMTEATRLKYSIPEEVGMKSGRLEQIERIVREGLDAQAFPGCQVLIVKDGVVIYNEAFGYFDYSRSKQVTVEDVYDLASVTKATATVPAIMKLYDEGKIKLNDRLSTYVPELKGTDKAQITVREALFHQSGLTSFIPFYQMAIDRSSYTSPLIKYKRDNTYSIRIDDNAYANKDFKFKGSLVSTEPKPDFTLLVADHFYLHKSFQDSIKASIVRSSLKNPGGYRYSDLNFILLKEAVENITHHSFDYFTTKEFYARLGAGTTTFRPLFHDIAREDIVPTEKDDFLRKQLIKGYVHDEAAAFMGGVSGHAGLFSNANDLAKLLQMFLNNGTYGGETYLSEATCQLFTQTKSPKSRRGLGFDKPDVSNPSKSPTTREAPGSVYGHTGFTGTCFWVDPDNQMIYIFLANRIHPHRWYKKLTQLNIRPRIQQVIYEAM